MKRKIKTRFYLILFILMFLLILNIGNIIKMLYPVKHLDHIKTYATQYGVDPYLIMGIIKTESNFEADAVSHKNATGLMQIMEPTAKWLATKMELADFSYTDITDPALNIQMGCYYIHYLLEHYDGNTENALAAYNAGQGTVDKWLKNPEYSKNGDTLSLVPYPETRKYIQRVINNQKIYSRLYPHSTPYK